ncbi:hypothetical protein PVT01_000040800 [Plasmodium vivax]|uniref:VIR protein n=1 Tax=Plasmodium vivax TaxID=5855 RepID=A0A1G4E3S2_PLAVI|nr:hypothetical protein PVT01_000040800 [Plasmodium vivax]
MSDEAEYTLDKIKDEHRFMNKSKFSKIYDVFLKKCENFDGDFMNESCYKSTFPEIKGSPTVTSLLKELYSNLFRAYETILFKGNTYFDYVECTNYKLCYTSLKYWLYDQIIIKDLKEKEINEIITGWETYIKNKVKNIPRNQCLFNELTLDEIKRLKNIYALYAVLYDNNVTFENCKDNKCKYLEYFGKGLDELISSINSCFSNPSTTNYCNEFNEFLELCKEDKENAGIIIYDEITQSIDDDTTKYLLYSEENNDKPLYIYLKDEKLLNFVKTSDFLIYALWKHITQRKRKKYSKY